MLSDNYIKIADIIPYASHKRPNLHCAKLQTNNSSSAETLRHRPNQCASGGLKVFQIGTYAVLTNMGIYWDISWYIMRYTTQKNDFGSAWKRGIPWNAHFLQEKWCLLLIQHQISVTNFSAKPTSNFGGLGEHLSLIARNNRLILLFFIIFGLPSESSGAITSLCNPWLPAFVLVILLLKLYIYITYISSHQNILVNLSNSNYSHQKQTYPLSGITPGSGQNHRLKRWSSPKNLHLCGISHC